MLKFEMEKETLVKHQKNESITFKTKKKEVKKGPNEYKFMKMVTKMQSAETWRAIISGTKLQKAKK